MNEVAATQVIYARANDEWDATPVIYGAGKRRATSPEESWIRVSVSDETSRVARIGSGTSAKNERRGRVFCQVFAIPAEGTDSAEGVALELAKTFRALFENRSLPDTGDPVIFLAGTIRRQGVDGPWFHVNAEIPFFFHDSAPT